MTVVMWGAPPRAGGPGWYKREHTEEAVGSKHLSPGTLIPTMTYWDWTV